MIKMLQSELNKCRTCLKSEKKLQQLEEQMNLKFIQITYKEALVALTNITFEVHQEDKMPRGICKNCTRKLQAAQEFIKQAQDANCKLLSLMGNLEELPIKQIDCLREHPIDVNETTNKVQVKMEVECGESQFLENANISANVFNLKLEQIEDQAEIVEGGSVSIDPLPENCPAEHCNNEAQKSKLPSNDNNAMERHRKCKIVKNIKLEGDDLLPVGCEECGKIYDNAEQLARHRKGTHLPEELKIPCPNCGRKFSRRHNMYTHMRKFHGTESVENLLKLPDSVSARKKYQCDKCTCKYTNKYKLQRHVKRKHEIVKKETSPDGAQMSSTKHKMKNPYRFLCTICGLAVYSQSALTIHVRRHTGEKPFKCNMCDKAYARLYDVQMHRRTHTGEKPHICSICSKAFRRSNKLTIHMRTHTNERPYKCTQCERSFKQSKDLRIHIRIHTGERPYKCNVCYNTFTQSNSLKAHRMKYGHMELNAENGHETNISSDTPITT